MDVFIINYRYLPGILFLLGNASYTRVICLLKDLTPADLKLIDPGFMGIRFTVQPQESEHNLSLIVKDADRTYQETMKATFYSTANE